MNDSQKWLEAAAAIEEDIQYLKPAVSERDLASLRIARAVYLKNARNGVAWPNPDDLYCIETPGCEPQAPISTKIRADYKLGR